MKKYLIEINTGRCSMHTTIYGDSSRPFMIANNLWNYLTPWDAGKRLKKIAKSWEAHGFDVEYTYGTVEDMPTRGDQFNVNMTLNEFCNRIS